MLRVGLGFLFLFFLIKYEKRLQGCVGLGLNSKKAMGD
jgi:hypothetical protein